MVSDDGRKSQEVAKVSFSETELRSIESLDDAIRLYTLAAGEAPVAVQEEIGDGFERVEKDELLNVPFMILNWRWGFSETMVDDKGLASQFAVVRGVAQHPRKGTVKFFFTDGSTGIAHQLHGYEERTGKTGGLLVAKGLRESTYKTVDAANRPVEATTYYLDTSM